jgi:histidyl-tRNA synthetase
MFKKLKNEKAYSNQIMKPKIFLIQFGFMARIKSFEVIDILRQNKITIYQNLRLEKLTDQFDMARKMGIPNVIVIGHQEAQDNTVAFRNIKEATHEIIKIEKIAQYLKKLNLI